MAEEPNNSKDAQKEIACVPAGTFKYGDEKEERARRRL